MCSAAGNIYIPRSNMFPTAEHTSRTKSKYIASNSKHHQLVFCPEERGLFIKTLFPALPFFCFIPFIILALRSCSLPVIYLRSGVTYHSGPSSPIPGCAPTPLGHVPSFLSREENSAFSSLADSRRITAHRKHLPLNLSTWS